MNTNRRPLWHTFALCIFVWVLLVGIPLLVCMGLLRITELMEAAR